VAGVSSVPAIRRHRNALLLDELLTEEPSAANTIEYELNRQSSQNYACKPGNDVFSPVTKKHLARPVRGR
jgi:hypothetical protein